MLERERWNDAWAALGASPPPGILAELEGRYEEPHRAYHTRQHIRECFATLEPAGFLAEHLAEVQLALWFHDAIYDPRAGDNEERSALWARSVLAADGVPSAAATRVHDLVLATRHAAAPIGADAQVLVDVDLSILGAADARFAEYEQQVRREYSFVPDEAFRQGRRRILTSFLERGAIFSTRHFADCLEARARENLARSLRELGAR